MVAHVADRYGRPSEALFDVEVTSDDFDYIRSTQKNDRAHDVTLYVLKEGDIVTNAKHFYPRDLFRAPSGGLNPGESIDDAIARELWEETGCRAAIEHFVLISRVRFIRGDRGRLLSVRDAAPRLATSGAWSGGPNPPRKLIEVEDDDVIRWTSYVFQLRYLDGDFDFTDHREIREVSVVPLSAFDQIGRTMRASDKGGLHYRAALHERVEPLL